MPSMDENDKSIKTSEKFCPYLPPIPEIDRLTGRIATLRFHNCLQEPCAIYEDCQGRRSRKAVLGQLAHLAESLKSAPFIGPALEGIPARIKTALGLD